MLDKTVHSRVCMDPNTQVALYDDSFHSMENCWNVKMVVEHYIPVYQNMVDGDQLADSQNHICPNRNWVSGKLTMNND